MAITKTYAKLEDFEDSIKRASLVTAMWDIKYIPNKEGGLDGAVIELTSIEVGAGLAMLHIYQERLNAQVTNKEQMQQFNQVLGERVKAIITEFHTIYAQAIIQEGAYGWQP